MKKKLTGICGLFLLLPSFAFAADHPQKFSDEAWQKITPIYTKIRNHPFNIELEKGILEKRKFNFYATQDAYYLKDYAKSLALLAAKLDNSEDAKMVLNFAKESLAEGIDEWHPKAAKNPAPATLLYTNFELSTAAFKSPEELAATLLPCFWIYAELGKELTQKAISPNPYDAWLNDYRNPSFQKETAKMIDLTNRLAAKASPALRQKMLKTFIMASKMELNFWDSAYKLENWPSFPEIG